MSAPPALLDPTGRPLALVPTPLAVGGEGGIYALVGDPAVVAKVYKEPQPTERSAKLRAMADLATESLTAVAAWPTATLHQVAGGPVAGILMPRIIGSLEIHHLYSVAQRKKDFPDADWRFLIHAARNCALAFEAIHNAGHVIGDVNQKNILVSPRGIVHLVDCDSFQVRDSTGKVYRCDVGVPEFTPPELQGQSFRSVDRSPDHDRFGLAVMIFHLLMMGRHPFAGVYSGDGEMPLEQAISTGRFAYSSHPEVTLMRPPPGTPPPGLLAGPLLPLFERSFLVPGAAGPARPSPTEWQAALAAVTNQLAACPVDPQHVFPRSLGTCPWCRLVGSVGVLFFLPGVGVGVKLNPNFNLGAIWAEIGRWTAADLDYTRPQPTQPPSRQARPVPRGLPDPTPLPPPPGPGRLNVLYDLGAALGMVASLLLLCCARNVALVGLVGFSLWLLILIRTVPSRLARAERRMLRARERGLQAWEDENREWAAEYRRRITRRDQLQAALEALEAPLQTASTDARNAFNSVRGTLEATKQRYEAKTLQYQTERQDVVKNSRRSQGNQFLDSILIADHRIAGISSARLANLRSFGIETALDVGRLGAVKVPQIGPKLTERLVEWRDDQARNFQFDASLPSRELVTLERNHHALITQWETTLTNGPTRLRDLVTRFRPQRDARLRPIQVAVDQLDRAERDLAIIERMLT